MRTLRPPPTQASNPPFEVWRDGEGEIYAYAEDLGDKYCMHLPGLGSFRFSSRGDEISADVNNATNEDLVVDAYRRRVLPMALQVSGREVLHASAFRSAAGVIALCADSETGKSTIAFGFKSRGYALWADDLVAFEISDRGSRALSLPFTMRLRPSAAKLFDRESPKFSNTECDDDLNTECDDDLSSDSAPLAAICVLRRDLSNAAPVAVRSLSAAEAFAAVISHAWSFALQDGERKRRMINNYLELVARVPIFDIAFQPGLENLPAILDAIEALVPEGLAADLRG